jgi:hypothetical protein
MYALQVILTAPRSESQLGKPPDYLLMRIIMILVGIVTLFEIYIIYKQ